MAARDLNKAVSSHPDQIDLEDLLAPDRRHALQAQISAATSKRKAVAPVAARKTAAPLDRYRNQIPAELEEAARELVRLFLLAEATPKVTQTFDAAPKGRKRDDLQDEIRDAKVLLEKMRAEWHADFMRDIEWFVLQVCQRADGTPMRLEDSGALMLPGRSVEAQRWAGYGGMFRTLQAAAQFLSRQRALGQKGNLRSNDDKVTLENTLKALAQQRRIRNNR